MSRTVRLTNCSADAVEVVAVRTTCGCTAVAEDIVNAVVEPNGYRDIAIRFSSGASDGVASSRVMITFRRQNHEYTAIAEVRAAVTPEYRVVPRALAFGEIAEGDLKELTFRLDPVNDTTVTISDAHCPDRDFRVIRTENGGGPGRALAVQFCPMSHNARRDSNSFIRIVTTNALRREVHVPITATYRPEVEVKPPSIVLLTDQSRRIPELARVQLSSVHEWEITDVRYDAALISLECELHRARHQHELEVGMRRDQTCPFESTLTLTMSREDGSEQRSHTVAIPVQLVVGCY